MAGSFSESHCARSAREAEVRKIEGALRGYQVLTRDRLASICGSRHWREAVFDAALASAVRRGSVVKLTDDLYELNSHGSAA